MKRWWKAILLLIVLVLVLGGIVYKVKDNKNKNEKIEFFSREIKLQEGITIVNAKSYAGQFLEDGTDEIVSNVLLLQVRNDGEQSIQLADLIVLDEDGNEYNFRLTTLQPGREVALLELNRAEYDSAMKISSVQVENLVFFSQEPSLHEDVFEIVCEDNMITVKNISDTTVKEGRVCYKSVSGDIYIGGITYTVTLPEIVPGESTQLLTRHYTKGASELVFVSFVN